jgi:hypothetical protein
MCISFIVTRYVTSNYLMSTSPAVLPTPIFTIQPMTPCYILEKRSGLRKILKYLTTGTIVLTKTRAARSLLVSRTEVTGSPPKSRLYLKATKMGRRRTCGHGLGRRQKSRRILLAKSRGNLLDRNPLVYRRRSQPRCKQVSWHLWHAVSDDLRSARDIQWVSSVVPVCNYFWTSKCSKGCTL